MDFAPLTRSRPEDSREGTRSALRRRAAALLRSGWLFARSERSWRAVLPDPAIQLFVFQLRYSEFGTLEACRSGLRICRSPGLIARFHDRFAESPPFVVRFGSCFGLAIEGAQVVRSSLLSLRFGV